MALEDWFDRLGGVVHVAGNLHRSPLPITQAHVRALHAAGIRVVFSMEEAVPGPTLREQGFDWRPHFWTDDAPPTRAQVARFLDEWRAVPADVPVLVHCKAGWGRTGSAIACALVDGGWSSTRALDHYWSRVPAARAVMESNGQAAFVHGHAAARAGRGIEDVTP